MAEAGTVPVVLELVGSSDIRSAPVLADSIPTVIPTAAASPAPLTPVPVPVPVPAAAATDPIPAPNFAVAEGRRAGTADSCGDTPGEPRDSSELECARLSGSEALAGLAAATPLPDSAADSSLEPWMLAPFSEPSSECSLPSPSRMTYSTGDRRPSPTSTSALKTDRVDRALRTAINPPPSLLP